MKKLTALLLVIFALTASSLYAQQPVLKGTVTDTSSKQNLSNAVITLLQAKDSTLVTFTRADAKGDFEVKDVASGKYIVLITYPGYVEMIDTMSLVAGIPRNLSTIALITKEHMLEEVIVRQTIAPIRIKGDTTVFMADSFKVRAGASVEELLKILPGFTVNSKGEITAQGQKIPKVYVDGDEFFGDDPTMATQNLNAKDVKQVELYDKKSDQATITGIDDGEKTKAINLVMKDDAKKGYFGKVEGGTDFDKYYQTKITANKFTSSMKAGAYLTADRTGRNSMTWDEMQDFGNVTTVVMDGGIGISFDGSDEFSGYNTQGIPENLQGAAMYNKKYGTQKNSTTNNYSYNHQNLAGDSYTNSQYILPDTLYYVNKEQHNKSSKLRNMVSTKNDIKLDSATTLTINARGSWGKADQASTSQGEYLTEERLPVNRNMSNNYSTSKNNSSKADIFLNRKLNKAGTRSFTLSGGFTQNQSTSDGFLYNKIDYYTNGTINSSQITDQRKTSENTSNSWQALASYIMPLSKRTSLNLNYTFNSSNSEQDTRSFEKTAVKYDSLNLLYSNHFRFINTSHRTGFSLNYIDKKITFRGGAAIQGLALKQTNMYKDSSYSRNFTNFFPNANIRWKFSSSGSFYLSYNGSTQQPTLSQLQPILNNNEPLNLTIGNPNLKPAFNHNFGLSISDFKTLGNQNMYASGSLSFTENAFSSRSVVDAQGRRTNQTVNVNGNYNYYLSVSYGKQIKFMKLDVTLSPRINGSRYKSFVNGLENTTNNLSVGPTLRINKYIEKKLSLYITYGPNYTSSTSSINTDIKTKYWTQSLYGDLNYKLPKGLVVITNIEANFREKLSSGDRNNNTIIWNASIEKRILKNKDITAIVTVNDILNRQIGFNRQTTSNFISENTYTMVQRYAMLSLRWKFNKNKKVSDWDE